jgi:hypothetical protein
MPDFGQKFAAVAVEQMKASGASQQAIDAKAQEMAVFVKSYNNPLVNIAYTFIEPFPVGLIITLISAAILRRKKREDLNLPEVVNAQ